LAQILHHDDAAYVLDGLLYNESDLVLEEDYTDTHGYTEIKFAAFAMFGRRFALRIRGLKKQQLYPKSFATAPKNPIPGKVGNHPQERFLLDELTIYCTK
jgi:TnpA family transposase